MKEVLTPYLDRFVDRTKKGLDGVVGVYLHGSASMSAFVPTRSDVDLLVVTSSPLTAREKNAYQDEVSRAPCLALASVLSCPW